MTEDEYAEELEYLNDVVGWLGLADDKKRRVEFLHHIQRQAEYMRELLEEDA